jgi:uncharacterized membrane protein YeaQ/YmgE (transglycosylase-associated protein family)
MGRRGMTIDPVLIGIWVVLGALVGWVSSIIVEARGLWEGVDVVVGLVGAPIGGNVLPRIGVHIGAGIVAEGINAIIGAVVLLVVAHLVKSLRRKA